MTKNWLKMKTNNNRVTDFYLNNLINLSNLFFINQIAILFKFSLIKFVTSSKV